MTRTEHIPPNPNLRMQIVAEISMSELDSDKGEGATGEGRGRWVFSVNGG